MFKNILFVSILAVCFFSNINAQTVESAYDAVANMRIGWNLGNTLDSNSGDTGNMWIEAWTDREPTNYETAWGQPVTTRELIHMFKEAGFNAIRVPVTWYPHMGITVTVGQNANGDWRGFWDMSAWTSYDVDPAWMARVHEVVDYVIDEGMYCIVNVHHDTGASSTAWLRADEEMYAAQRERFEALWTQIANEFRDYDGHLLFEGYNEMLDSYSSWCFASFACPGNYNASVATSAYNAINSYAQSFVDAVRATGGYNAERNLIVSTYAACCGEGDWNSHLTDPLSKMKRPEDTVDDHIIFEVHSYPDVKNVNNAKSSVNKIISRVKSHLVSKGCPVIFGEWGTSTDVSNSTYKANLNLFARYFVETVKSEGMGSFYWMGLSDAAARSVPKWSDPDLKDAIVKGYYGEQGYGSISDVCTDGSESAIYDIMGRKVESADAPGLYIRNGRKFIVR